MDYRQAVETVGRVIEVSGVLVIVIGALCASISFARRWLRSRNTMDEYRPYRQNLGRSILLGLEFLVAGDIIRSIAVPPTLVSVVVLAIIVIIRSLLSIELEMEIEGRWPWHKQKAAGSASKHAA